MNDSPPVDTDAFLLNLDDGDFVQVGSMLGLRARPTTTDDLRIVDQFLDSEVFFSPSHRPAFVSTVSSPHEH